MKIDATVMEFKAAEKGLTLTELAREAGISRATVSGIIKKERCTGQVFLKIAKALGVEPKELFLKEQ